MVQNMNNLSSEQKHGKEWNEKKRHENLLKCCIMHIFYVLLAHLPVCDSNYNIWLFQLRRTTAEAKSRCSLVFFSSVVNSNRFLDVIIEIIPGPAIRKTNAHFKKPFLDLFLSLVTVTNPIHLFALTLSVLLL